MSSYACIHTCIQTYVQVALCGYISTCLLKPTFTRASPSTSTSHWRMASTFTTRLWYVLIGRISFSFPLFLILWQWHSRSAHTNHISMNLIGSILVYIHTTYTSWLLLYSPYHCRLSWRTVCAHRLVPLPHPTSSSLHRACPRLAQVCIDLISRCGLWCGCRHRWGFPVVHCRCVVCHVQLLFIVLFICWCWFCISVCGALIFRPIILLISLSLTLSDASLYH